MPISKENKSKYPSNWEEIVSEVRERDGNKCGFCGLSNKAWGVRDLTGKFWGFEKFMNGDVPDDIEFEKNSQELKKGFQIVLTTMHLDHDPTNNGELGNRPNLISGCQKCHLDYDRPLHLKNSKATRDKKKFQINLFT